MSDSDGYLAFLRIETFFALVVLKVKMRRYIRKDYPLFGNWVIYFFFRFTYIDEQYYFYFIYFSIVEKMSLN